MDEVVDIIKQINECKTSERGEQMKHIGKCGLTGKHDIDGTEILDGDIMEYCNADAYHPSPYLVEWSDDEAGFRCENGSNYMLASIWNQMRVIGNRCSNPVLLKACKTQINEERK